MAQLDLSSLISDWKDEISDLDDEKERIEERQDPMVEADRPAIRERLEPKIQADTVQSCIDDVEGSGEIDEILEVLGEWRDEAEERDKRIRNRNKWFRNNLKKHQLQTCIEDLEAFLPNEVFEECNRCGSNQKPTSDKKYNKGYRWECPDC